VNSDADADPGTGDPDRRVAAARERVLADHRRAVAGAVAAAASVADAWPGGGTADRGAVVGPLRAALAAEGIDRALVGALVDAVDAAGYDLRADPVAAPPYLAVTSTGPVLRATVADGRLVVAVETFAVDRSGPTPRYVRRDVDPGDALSVELRGRRDGAAGGDRQ
jgi:hypothetical protein